LFNRRIIDKIFIYSQFFTIIIILIVVVVGGILKKAVRSDERDLEHGFDDAVRQKYSKNVQAEK
jgi:hypothetical protein